MKQDIHPEWYTSARVTCACGNTWITGSTMPEIRTDVCSNCHPFYTGEQRIVDTEGQVDRFMKRLQARDQIMAEKATLEEAKAMPDMAISELELGSRYEKALENEGITSASDIINLLAKGGDEAITSIRGIGHQTLIDIKRGLRSLGYELPETD